MKRTKKELAENIRLYRLSLGMTQSELAEKLFAQKSLISNYENGYSTPDIYTIIKLADIFDVSIDDLIGRNRPQD